jgi:DNA (cytosine-5)-methyltransferase 1
MKEKKYTVLDLFCGCGGLSKGLQDSGLHLIGGIDNDERAIESYQLNFKHPGICADLTQYSPEIYSHDHSVGKGEIDIIVSSPPCQGFSIAGRRNKEDPRNTLFMEHVRYLDYFQPRAFLMENVIGILSARTKDENLVIDIILEELGKDYNCLVSRLYASDFEVPQNRRRAIIFGIRKDLNILPTEPQPPITCEEDRIPVSTVLERREEVDPGQFLSERAIKGILRKKANSKKKGYGFGAQFLDPDKPSYTIPARYWKDGYDALVRYNEREIRRLSLKEIKRIQTFPDDFQLAGSKREQITQLGNAVAVRFAYHLGSTLREGVYI